MQKEIHTGEVFYGIRRFLKKYCEHHGIPEPDFTLAVYYKAFPDPGAVLLESGDKNPKQRKECLELLATMLDTKTETSAPFDFKGEIKVGAIASENMIIVMGGVEPALAKALIIKMLHHQKVLSNEDYLRMYDHLKSDEIFAILVSWTITSITLSTNPESGLVFFVLVFFDCFFGLNTYI